MNYFTNDTRAAVYAIEDKAEVGFLPEGLLPITEQECNEILAQIVPKANHTDVAKSERMAAVAAIVVTTTAGNTFDGNELAQGRIARAIAVMADGDTRSWVLADNVPVSVSKAELAEALKLANEVQDSLWLEPYNVAAALPAVLPADSQ